MGTMTCDRKDCENMMCGRYSKRYGHICKECFEELVARGADASVEEFMGTPKYMAPDPEAAQARFDVEFPVLSYKRLLLEG